jgi:hypothetical protein
MGWVSSCETGLISRCRSRSAEEKATPHTRNGLRGWASRSRRPHARGDVLLYGTWEASSVSAGHAGPAHEGKSRTLGFAMPMFVLDEIEGRAKNYRSTQPQSGCREIGKHEIAEEGCPNKGGVLKRRQERCFSKPEGFGR